GIDDDLRPFLLEQLAVVHVPFGRVAGHARRLGGGLVHLPLVAVAQGHQLAFAGGQGLAKNIAGPPAAANDGGGVTLAGLGGSNGRGGGKGQTGRGGRLDELSAVHARHRRQNL